MQTEIAVIGDEYFVIGFECVGIKNSFVTTENNVNNIFEEILKKENIGIVLTEKKTFDLLSERMKEKVNTQVKPTVLILSHDISGEENLRIMIKRSLGIDLWKGD